MNENIPYASDTKQILRPYPVDVHMLMNKKLEDDIETKYDYDISKAID